MHSHMTQNQDSLPKDAIRLRGKPLLSWRVALLPYLDQEALYKQFKLDEAWDSEHNKKLIEKMPRVFAMPGSAAAPGHTHYRVFVGPGTVFEPREKGLRLIDFNDGASNTILVVEAADPVIWTKPDDLPVDSKKPLPKLGVYTNATHVLMGDGSVWKLAVDIPDDALKGLVTHSGGELGLERFLKPVPWRGPALQLEFQRAAAGPPQPVLLRSFDPAKDKAILPEPKPGRVVTVEDGAWRIESASGGFSVVPATLVDGIPDEGVIICRAKVKVRVKDQQTRGEFHFGVVSDGYDWPEHLAQFHGDVPEWTQKEARVPVRVIRKKEPPVVTVYTGLNDEGVLWIKDLELLYLPSPGQAAVLPRPAPKPVLLRSFDPAKDKAVPLRGDPMKIVLVEDGAWRIENAFDRSVSGNFRIALGTITDGIPEDGLLICRAKVKLKPKAENGGWGSLQLNAASPSFHGYNWPAHLEEYHGEITEWAEKEVRYPVEIIRKKNPPTITIHVGLHGNGVLWVKDVELLHLPPAPKNAPNPATLQPLRDAVSAQTQTLRTVNERFSGGKASPADVMRAEDDLTEARIKLAEAEGDKPVLIWLLEEWVRKCEGERTVMIWRIETKLERPWALIPADVRLAKAKAGLGKVNPPSAKSIAPEPRSKP